MLPQEQNQVKINSKVLISNQNFGQSCKMTQTIFVSSNLQQKYVVAETSINDNKLLSDQKNPRKKQRRNRRMNSFAHLTQLQLANSVQKTDSNKIKGILSMQRQLDQKNDKKQTNKIIITSQSNSKNRRINRRKKQVNILLFQMQQQQNSKEQIRQNINEIQQQDIRQSSNLLKNDQIINQNTILTIRVDNSPRISYKQQNTYQSKSKFIKYINRKNYKQSIYRQLPNNIILSLKISINYKYINNIWPEYYLEFLYSKDILLTAKKTSYSLSPTYSISTSKNNFEQNSINYIGKLKGNFNGSIYNIYGPGLNPKNAKQSHEIPRQLLGTIIKQKLNNPQGDTMKVFIKKDSCNYYLGFPQVKMYQQQISLDKLYKYYQNRDKIQVFTSKNSKYERNQNQKYLFRTDDIFENNKQQKFILQNLQNNKQVLLLYQQYKNTYKLKLSSPISCLIGFSIILTHLNTKIYKK